MDKYKIIKALGEGTFGTVTKYVNIETEECVAIKKLKAGQTWEEALEMNEIKSLKKINNHSNVVKVLEMIRLKDQIYIVFEFCERNLFHEMQN